MKKFIFAFDLDDTLIGNHSLKSPTTEMHIRFDGIEESMKTAIKKGYQVWIVTANWGYERDHLQKLFKRIQWLYDSGEIKFYNANDIGAALGIHPHTVHPSGGKALFLQQRLQAEIQLLQPLDEVEGFLFDDTPIQIERTNALPATPRITLRGVLIADFKHNPRRDTLYHIFSKAVLRTDVIRRIAPAPILGVVAAAAAPIDATLGVAAGPPIAAGAGAEAAAAAPAHDSRRDSLSRIPIPGVRAAEIAHDLAAAGVGAAGAGAEVTGADAPRAIAAALGAPMTQRRIGGGFHLKAALAGMAAAFLDSCTHMVQSFEGKSSIRSYPDIRTAVTFCNRTPGFAPTLTMIPNGTKVLTGQTINSEGHSFIEIQFINSRGEKITCLVAHRHLQLMAHTPGYIKPTHLVYSAEMDQRGVTSYPNIDIAVGVCLRKTGFKTKDEMLKLPNNMPVKVAF